jgi:CTD small phosphatase-like protein 2
MFSKNTDSYVTEIKSNNSCVYDYLRIILKNYPFQNEITDSLISYFKNISKLNIQILNEFFRSKVIRVMNKNASVLASVLLNSGEKIEQIAVPYLKKESLKEYTLVLDLDETLIHFKIDIGDENKGLLRLRPGIFEFLDAVSKYYELVVFTAATQDVRILFYNKLNISMLILF